MHNSQLIMVILHIIPPKMYTHIHDKKKLGMLTAQETEQMKKIVYKQIE